MQKTTITFFGTPEYANTILKALIKEPSFEINLVITQPDRKVGRKQIVTPPPVKITAEENSIPTIQPQSCKNNPELIKKLKETPSDIHIVAAYGHILPTEILNITQHGAINVHASLLPKYRGASPIQGSLLNGDTSTGVTIIQMNEKMDAGDILSAKDTPIEEADTTETLMNKLAQEGAELLIETIKLKTQGQITPLPQNHEEATYCQKITRQDGKINPETQTATDIKNQLRAFTPWPGCYTFINDKRLKIIEAKAIKSAEIQTLKSHQLNSPNHNTQFELIEFQKDSAPTKHLGIKCKQDILELITIQLEGKTPSSASTLRHLIHS